jgi:rubrerythrin
MNRLTLRKLVYTSDGAGKLPAIIDFAPGFNVISGPSDTGKSLIFECINYALGSSKPPKDRPESRGYTTVFLSVLAGEEILTLRRSTRSKAIIVYKSDYDNIGDEGTEKIVLSDSAQAADNISDYLLSIIGMKDKRLKKNEKNETKSLTFNILRKLLLVNETKIQKETSPIFTDNLTDSTSEKALLRYMLTGIDYSDIIAVKDAKIRKADANARINLLDKLIGSNSTSLKENTSKEELEKQLEKLTLSIDGETNKVFENQNEIEDLREQRRTSFENAIAADSKIDQLKEILSRFTLLAQHYKTDLERLDAIIEAGNGLSGVIEINCPLCGSESEHHRLECAISDKEISEIKISCEREKKKINSLNGDLLQTINQVQNEILDLSGTKETNESEFKRIDKVISDKLEPNIFSLKNHLRELFETKKEVEMAISTLEQVKVMQDLKASAEKDLKTPTKASISPVEVKATEAAELIRIIEKNLIDWSYPSLHKGESKVIFSELSQDIAIGDKDRASQGKGYRAITYAAWIISLMELCLDKKMSHPGFVVLDSPLVTYRPADKPILENDAISDNMAERFYSSLCNLAKDRQVIILENENPSTKVIEKINYVHFTRNAEFGRYGFIPPIIKEENNT